MVLAGLSELPRAGSEAMSFYALVRSGFECGTYLVNEEKSSVSQMYCVDRFDSLVRSKPVWLRISDLIKSGWALVRSVSDLETARRRLVLVSGTPMRRRFD
ncbi:pentatricopeptide repeat-containing protein-like [Dorcoceras hygrometricum]|uniref:Pentatricopeptide repeat-containing protein-like n=1 Tax=Dorcoceras hygrometricum TaxID=472368 RepID=A0A2Z7C0I6_9LAMI|nr:pentatricopeptide repeat-containing protein-like [Dorcoceras hygrometricum]